MSAPAVTIDRMGKKSNSGQKPNRRPSVTLYARVDPVLGEAFKRYVESIRPKTDVQSMLELLMEQCLAEKGLWPPSGD